MKNKFFLAVAVLAAASAQPVLGCDLCSIYSAQEAQGANKGYFAGVAEQFTYFGTLLNDGQKEAANGEYIDSSVAQFFFGYNFNHRFGLQFNLPLIYREYGSATARGSDFGIGDASLVGNVLIYQKFTEDFTFNWTALGGIKFPTGNSRWLGRADFATGIGGHDLALGSGSFDALLGTGFSARWKKVFFTGQMQYAIRTEGDFQHQYANDWTWSGGPGVYLALQDRYTLALQFTTSGESKGKDTFAGVPDGDSAETIVYVGPEISFTWSENFSAHIGVDLPVSIENSGEQLMPDYRIHAATTWRF
jgi:hypothetical protein